MQAGVLWHKGIDLPGLVQQYGQEVDEWEIQVVHGERTDLPSAVAWSACRARMGLAAVVAGERVGGKQHPRTRIGFRAGELSGLAKQLRQAGIELYFTLCRLDPAAPTAGRTLEAAPGLGRLDFVLPLPPAGPEAGQAALAALFAGGMAARLFIEPLIELDRTMDGQTGLLDPLCNPTPLFEPLRLLHAVLEDAKKKGVLPGAVWEEEEREGILALSWQGNRGVLRLLLPRTAASLPAGWYDGVETCYELQTGTVIDAPAAGATLKGPLLLAGYEVK